jgi:hypothetical protein
LVPAKVPGSARSDYAVAAVILRAARDSITRVMPLMIMLTPTNVPSAQIELDGQ